MGAAQGPVDAVPYCLPRLVRAVRGFILVSVGALSP